MSYNTNEKRAETLKSTMDTRAVNKEMALISNVLAAYTFIAGMDWQLSNLQQYFPTRSSCLSCMPLLGIKKTDKKNANVILIYLDTFIVGEEAI